MSDKTPFWKRMHYRAFNREQWESLCDGCGRCCLFRLEDEDTGERYFTNVCCNLFDSETCRCTDYPNRKARVPACVTLTPDELDTPDWLPATCAYRLIAEGEDLHWWHPLVSGDPETVVAAGISVRGRVIHERDADDPEHHLIDWPDAP